MTTESAGPTLERLQNWFLAAITHPDGVGAGVESADARRHINVEIGETEGVLTRSKSLRALDRLAVYGHAYLARLLDCLRDEYPVLRTALGDEVFDAFVAEYLQRYPSRTYTLFDLGAWFPQFLRDTRPTDSGSETDWPDFLIDLATLERTFNEVFDGPGIEGGSVLDAATVAAVPSDRLAEVRLVPVPCLRVLSFKYPVHTYFTAVRRAEEATYPEPGATYLAITRQRYIVRHFELSKPAHVLLSALLAGEPLGTAINGVAALADSAELEHQLGGWFHDWAAQGFFLGIRGGEATGGADTIAPEPGASV